MSEEFIIRPGDLVVCVDGRLPEPLNDLHRMCRDRVSEGEYYRVTAVIWLYGEKGLHLEGKDHRPTEGWRSSRFRKVAKDETTSNLSALAKLSLNVPADASIEVSQGASARIPSVVARCSR